MDLQGKVAVITGASGGIGEAVARDLSNSGCKLVLTARSADKLQKLCEELGDAVFIAAEVTDETLPERLLDLAIERFGRADVLFNNAGVMAVGAIDEVDIDEMCRMVRINVEALVRFAYTFLRRFKAQDSGYVINTSSMAGTLVPPLAGVYAGTKHAVEAFSEALWNELSGTGVGVAAIEPGTVATGLYDTWGSARRDWAYSIGALEPQDIVEGVRFILTRPPHVRVARIQTLPAGVKPGAAAAALAAE